MTACANTQEPSDQISSMPGVLAEEFVAYKRGASLTDVQKEILADDWITDQEWHVLVDEYLDCMAEQGLEGEVGTRQVSYGVTIAGQDAYAANFPADQRDQALADAMNKASECAKTTVSGIGYFYFEPRNNPDGVTYLEAIRRCFAKQELTELSVLADEELHELMRNPQIHPQATQKEASWCFEYMSYGDWEPTS